MQKPIGSPSSPSSSPGARFGVLGAVIGLCIGIAAGDLTLPPAVAVEVLYVVAVLVAARSPRPRDVYLAAGLATVLTALGMTLAGGADTSWPAAVNRGAVVFAIWATAIVVARRRRLEIEQAWLIRELDHRVRNNLSAVLGVADQTVAGSSTLAEFTPAFAGRLRSMSVAHELLARSGWRGVPFDALIERVVEPYRHGNPERFVIAGPAVMLPADVAPSIGMAVHELVTRASRGGVLNAFEGRVLVEWGREIDADDAARLRVTWTEQPAAAEDRGAEEREQDEIRLDHLIAYQTGGRVEHHHDDSTRRCDLVIPMETLDRVGRPGPARFERARRDQP